MIGCSIFCSDDVGMNVDMVGRKAYYLTRIRKKYRVPEFVIIDAKMFLVLINKEENKKLKVEIKEVLETSFTRPEKLKTIQDEIKKIKIPDEWVEELTKSLKENNVRAPYAIRSSTSREDNCEESGAGIFESVVNVSESDIWDGIKYCWASMFQRKAINYGKKYKSIEEFRMSIILQSYVVGIRAGVIFSIDPVVPERGMILEYMDENAEKLMSGEKSALCKKLGFKELRQGNDEEDWVNELIDISDNLRKLFGFETDIEWVIDQEHRLYLLQCRPVTAVRQTKHSEWMFEMQQADRIPASEKGGLSKLIALSIKSIGPFYEVCSVLSIQCLKWYFLRYNRNTDCNRIQACLYQECGIGKYCIRLNEIQPPYWCNENELAKTLTELLRITRLDVLTISIQYRPKREYAIQSFYDWRSEICRIDACTELKEQMELVEKYSDKIKEATKAFTQYCIYGRIEWSICEDGLYAVGCSEEDSYSAHDLNGNGIQGNREVSKKAIYKKECYRKTFYSESKLLSVLADLEGKFLYEGQFRELFPEVIIAKREKDGWGFYLQEEEYCKLQLLGRDVYENGDNVQIYLKECEIAMQYFETISCGLQHVESIPRSVYSAIVTKYREAYSKLLSVYRLSNREYTNCLKENNPYIESLAENRLKLRKCFMKGNVLFQAFLKLLFDTTSYSNAIPDMSFDFIINYLNGEKTQLLEVNECICNRDHIEMKSFSKYNFSDKKEIGNEQEVQLTGTVVYAAQTISGTVVYGTSKSRDLYDKEVQDKILVVNTISVYQDSIYEHVVGIICEEGGILSHAAIIARERKIPCLIDVKDATKRLFEGDMIVLDSNAGVIRKLIH